MDWREGVVLIVKYSKDSLKYLAKQEKKTVERIRAAITGLTEKPPVGDIKPMQGAGEGRYRLRIGSWRVIYRYDLDGIVEVLFIIDIGNRGDVYK